MTLLLHKLIPKEIILHIFSFVSVVDMRNVVVNHQLLRLFHDPQLWKRRVEALLFMCTPEARYEVERHLAGASHLWSQQLKHDVCVRARMFFCVCVCSCVHVCM